MAEDPKDIRADIADTRERLSNTIEEIGERLNPQALKENVKDSIREATIGRVSTMARQAADTVSRTTSGVTSTVRDNPIPAAMVAIGIGWMVWNARANRTDGRSRGMDVGYGADYGASYDTSDEGFGATLGSEGPYFSGELDDRSGSGITGRAKERARHIGDVAQRRAGELYGTAADATRRGAQRVEDTYHENPLAMGAVAMAIGLAAGLAAPVTDREVRWMGDARDQLVDRVKEVADETREKAEHVASRVAKEAKTAAREEGLTQG